MVRVLLLIAAPVVIVWAFVSTLTREIAMAFVYAWLEVRIEASALAHAWRTNSLKRGDWQ